jgi:hypothetical protein
VYRACRAAHPEAQLAYFYGGHGNVQVFEKGPIELQPGFTIEEILS